MNNLLDNIYKFPRFLISIILGFFLTTFQPIFKLLKNKKTNTLILTVILIILTSIYTTIKLMLSIN
uniref:Uncharacterized protein ycf33 n=1 Tax=Callithamnion tetricum TaxID=193179 RepID=A0A4D6WRR1_9FLOR|nr:hypothetical protein [Callithamnion tetricum]